MKTAIIALITASLLAETSPSEPNHAVNPLVNGLAFQPKNDLVKEEQISNTLNLITSIGNIVDAILKIGRTMSGSQSFISFHHIFLPTNVLLKWL